MGSRTKIEWKQFCATAKENAFSPRDVTAMKRIARMRLKDQGGRAKEELEALHRIGHAVGFDLFSWQQEAPE